MMKNFHDFAIPLAWPDKTAYGDEKWMSVLKSCGLVKNLNFKVGHAAILLVSRNTGQVAYYDFGRYVCPRGYGRVRSKHFDPRLIIQTSAIFDNTYSTIINIEEIMQELSAIEHATHGGGRLLFSIVSQIDYGLATQYAYDLSNMGPVPYGALATGNNSCSRFVAQMLKAGMHPKDKRIRKICIPETIIPSPTSNIVNTHQNKQIFCYADGQLTSWNMSRTQSLKFQWSLLKENLSHGSATTLGCDLSKGQLDLPSRPYNVPIDAQWLGGIGEGMWFHLAGCNLQEAHYIMSSYSHTGEIINQVWTSCPQQKFIITEPFEILAQMDEQYFTLLQHTNRFLFKKIEYPEANKSLKAI